MSKVKVIDFGGEGEKKKKKKVCKYDLVPAKDYRVSKILTR